MGGGGGGKGGGRKDWFTVKDDNKDATVWLGNIPEGVTIEEIQENFKSAGEVKKAKFLAKGTGMVWFADPASAKQAIQMFNGADINGSAIQVDVWTKKA